MLVERDGRLVLGGELDELDVPASLSSLLAARLDALEPVERALVKAVAVFGGAFARSAAAAMSDVPDEQLDAVLASLVRKQVLTIRADPLSPDRGQYAFAQTLLRTVAYEMLSRNERKPRHRAAAEHLRRSFPNDGEDVAEVVASHYLDAYRAAHDDADADDLRTQAIAALQRAAQRAATVGAPQSAERAYRTAIELTGDEAQRTELTRAAAQMAAQAGHYETALELFDDASAAHLAAGRERDAAHIAGAISMALGRLGRNEEAADRIRAALRILGADRLDAEVGALNCALGRALVFLGHDEEAGPALDVALRIAQALQLPALLSEALTYRGISYLQQSRVEEARLLFDGAIEIAERHDLATSLARAQHNLGNLGLQWDLPGAAEQFETALAMARRRGDRFGESIAACNLLTLRLLAGDWRELERVAAEHLDDAAGRPGAEFLHYPLAIVHSLRGEIEAARMSLDQLDPWDHSDDDEQRAMRASVVITLHLAEGSAADALEGALRMLGQAIATLGASNESVRTVWPDALEAALELGRLEDARALLALLADQPPGHVPPYLRAQLLRGRALTAAAEGDRDGVEADLGAAIDGLRSLGYPYWLARAQTDLAAWLIDQSRPGEAAPLLDEATVALESLGAAPALARAHALAGTLRAASAAG